MTYDNRLKDSATDALFEAILLLRDVDECYRFFQDIATVSELKALAQRLEVAKLLESDVTYLKIEELTGASSATISRVKRSLDYGANGYTLILERVKQSGDMGGTV
jgi:TrpR-related protein YerC/YecD